MYLNSKISEGSVAPEEDVSKYFSTHPLDIERAGKTTTDDYYDTDMRSRRRVSSLPMACHHL